MPATIAIKGGNNPLPLIARTVGAASDALRRWSWSKVLALKIVHDAILQGTKRVDHHASRRKEHSNFKAFYVALGARQPLEMYVLTMMAG